MGVTLIRYWGSYFKSPRAVSNMVTQLGVPMAKGWNTYLVCCWPPEEESWLQPLLDMGVKIEYVARAKGNFDWKCMYSVYKLCRRLRCDIFHCDNIHTSPLIGASLARVPVRLWSKRSMNAAFEEGRKETIRDKIVISVRLSCLLATKTLAVSRTVRDELIKLRIPSSKSMVFNNPMDSTNLRPADRDKARAAYEYTPNEIVIMTIGHAVSVKGWDMLLRAFSDITSEVPQARLLFVGSINGNNESPYYEELARFIDRNGLRMKVKFTGHLTDISEALATSDIFVLSSRSEGFSNALIEGLASGLPCVSTLVGGASELIRPGVNGFLIERENYREMAKVLLTLAKDSNLRKRLAEGAKTTPLGIPTMEEYGKRLFNFYESLIKEHTKN
jgi:glycosyltransferase involved in cell wall biosynthesis